MISKEQALELAFKKLKSSGFQRKKYSFDSCDFYEEKIGKYAAPARWIVRFTKPPSLDGSVTDDGDDLFVVSVEADSGAVRIVPGM